MTLQQLARRARRTALILVLGGAAIGCASVALIIRAYTRPLTPKGTPS